MVQSLYLQNRYIEFSYHGPTVSVQTTYFCLWSRVCSSGPEIYRISVPSPKSSGSLVPRNETLRNKALRNQAVRCIKLWRINITRYLAMTIYDAGPSKTLHFLCVSISALRALVRMLVIDRPYTLIHIEDSPAHSAALAKKNQHRGSTPPPMGIEMGISRWRWLGKGRRQRGRSLRERPRERLSRTRKRCSTAIMNFSVAQVRLVNHGPAERRRLGRRG
eukprot:SAG11_NODE_92_length_17132_cov_10.277285_5_plen_219_part_00